MPQLELTLGEYHEVVLDDASRFRVLNAGRGFGKSQLILGLIAKHLTISFNLPHKIWYLAPTYKMGRRDFWPRLKAFFAPITVHKNEQDLTLTLTNGATISVIGSDQSDKLRGAYLTLAIFDEAAFHRQGYWSRVIRPMLGRITPFGQAVWLSTPDGHNEFYDLFQRGQDPTKEEWASWQFTSMDGGFVPESEVMAAKDGMTEEDWRQEYLGEFVASAGRAYYAFDRKVNCKKVQHVPAMDIHWAWDFNENPACHSTLCHIHEKKVYAFDEIAIGNTQRACEEFILRYPKASLLDPKTGKMPAIHIYGDASGTRATSGLTDYMMIQHMLHEYGYPEPTIKVDASNPLVKNRVNSVNVMLKNAAGESRIFINGEKCTRLIKDFENVKWARNQQLDKVTDHTLTHASDGFGYMVWQEFPIESPAIKALRGRQPKPQTINGYWV